MSATVIEKMTRPPDETHDANLRSDPPRKNHLLRWSLLALVGCVIVLTVLLGLIQKLLWMRQLDFAGIFWTLLSVKWGIFGVALIFGFLYLWINLRFAVQHGRHCHL
jgi:ABC-type sugar transport system permease subunit